MSSSPIVECVPNFSEGRDRSVLDAISAQVESVDGVRLLDVDPGAATHRTVFTFAGPPEAVVEAAVRAARAGCERIDMRRHKGAHPRFGALDVCPLVPISGITLEEAAEWARRLGRRLADELGLTIFLYEAAASRPGRKNLADIRAGEYEGLPAKLADPEWTPDFGPSAFNPRSGATVVGARNFLVAYNVNLNTTSVRRANAVAFDVREQGRVTKHEVEGETRSVRQPGTLQGVKAIGWFIEEYGIAQISMNLTDLGRTRLHEAFDEVSRAALARGIRVTGSELVGLVPLQAMLEAGRHYLRQQQRSLGVPDRELIRIAIRTMGLDELSPFDPEKKIVEYALRRPGEDRLASLTLTGFVEETASESPAPGGGSVAAALGAMGAALGTMVANLSSHKKGWDERWEEFSGWAEKGKAAQIELLRLVDDDTRAFDGIKAAMKLSKATPDEVATREAAITAATRRAIEVPLRVMEVSLRALEVARTMAGIGLPASASDAGVGALSARAAVAGAYLNVRINAKDFPDRAQVAAWLDRAAAIDREAEAGLRATLELLERNLAPGT